MSWYTEIVEWAKAMDAKRQREHDVDFCDFAYRELQAQNFHKNFNLHEDIKEILESKEFPKQAFPKSAFGDPPVTLYISKDKSFHLDLYIWMRTQTAIHQHSFRGAFTVLQGMSLESEYSFKKDKPIGHSFWGTLSKKELHLIHPGEVRPIHYHEQLIHRVLHLSRPTISLVLRTNETNHSNPQYNYDFDMLASPGHLPGDVIGKMRLLQWYLENGLHPTYAMLQPILHHAETWIKLFNFPHTHKLMHKLAFVHADTSLLSGIMKQKLFHNLFDLLPSENDKILLSVYEHFGEAWAPWLQTNLNISEQDARERLKKIIVENPAFNESLKENPLIKTLFVESPAESV